LKGREKVKNRLLSLLLAAVLALSVGLIGCTAEVPEITQYTLTISSTEGGQVTRPGEGIHTYDGGTKVNLVAVAEEGYQFASWTGDVSTVADVEDATTTITMSGDYSIRATFAVKQYSLVIHSTEGGSVTTPGETAYTYDKGEVVNLAAVADEGYQFIDWTGDVGTVVDVNAASTTITMNGGYSIIANFARAIRDWYDLDAIRNNLDDNYVLMNDLDSATAGYGELASRTANGGKGWAPIGSIVAGPNPAFIVDPVEPLTGSFDGHGYEIRDLFINRPDEDCVGLFSCVDEGGVIENLRVITVTMVGHSYVGNLVGWNGASVSNLYSSGSIIGYEFVGGLAGGNWGAVANSSLIGSVSGTYTVGGLVGNNRGTVGNSYSSASVTGDSQVGSLVGWNYGGTITDSYSCGTVFGYSEVGGLLGSDWGIVSNSHYDYDEALINGRNVIAIGALSSDDFEKWLANGKFLDVNERLSREDGYYLINNVSDFRQLLAFGQDSSLRFRLTTDLDLRNVPDFYIPYIAGEFDGDGHKILNLRLDLQSVPQAGLFGCLASGGKITRVGVENADITGSIHVGSLVGTINGGSVSSSYFAGSVTGESNVGGLVGFLHFGTVSDCYFINGEVTGYNKVGGLVGENHYGTISNSYYDYDKVLINGKKTITTGALFAEDFAQWLVNDKFLDVNERLSQENGYYVINNVSDFRQLLAFGQNSSLKFGLKSDLDLATQSNFYIPYLAGEFDGNGHKISNLRLNLDAVFAVGLFGWLAPGGKVTQVGVENVNITGSDSVGGLIGRNWQGTVSNSYSTGMVTDGWKVGGLVGWNGGSIGNSCSSSSVAGHYWVGGLVGVSEGPLSNSYSSGSVTGEEQVGGLVGLNVDTLSNCYSTSRALGEQHTGGLVGVNSLGTVSGAVTSSFWNAQTSGQVTSDGGTGKVTSEMQSIDVFSGAGWNIVAVANPSTRNSAYIWNIVDGQTYPFLSWQS
jgi:hypothetical protein